MCGLRWAPDETLALQWFSGGFVAVLVEIVSFSSAPFAEFPADSAAFGGDGGRVPSDRKTRLNFVLRALLTEFQMLAENRCNDEILVTLMPGPLTGSKLAKGQLTRGIEHMARQGSVAATVESRRAFLGASAGH